MARARLTDPLQGCHFWISDVSPSVVPPFFVLNPAMGFTNVSAPEIAVEHNSYRPINSMFPVFTISGATVSPITLRKGVHLGGNDLYRWIMSHINGTDETRRNLMLVQFHGKAMFDLAGGLSKGIPTGGNIGAPFGKGIVRVPGRAWMLYGCVPTRYNAGDFDAKSSEISVQELEVQPRRIVQVDLGSVV